MDRGPVEVLFLTYPVDADPAEVVGVLREPVDSGMLRVIDLVLLLRGIDGSIDVRDVQDERWASAIPAGMELDPQTLLSDVDIDVLSDSVPEDQQGIALVLEHAWARGAASELADLNAELALYVRVPPDDVEAAFAANVG
jgi:hypothetical protein